VFKLPTPGLSTNRKLSRNASAVSDAPHMEWQVGFWGRAGRVRYSCLKEAAVRKRLCKFNGVVVMRKTRGIGGGANRSADRAGSIVVCVGKLEARSLVDEQRKRTRPVGAGGTERARSEREFHAAAPASQGGERSWSWAAVSLSMTTMGPPHLGQSQSGRGCLASEASGSDCDGCSASSSR
jgi:hypothetical protein